MGSSARAAIECPGSQHSSKFGSNEKKAMGTRIDLDRYREYFSDAELSFATIAVHMQVSRERVRQIYDLHFRPALGPRISRSVLSNRASRERIVREAATSEGISDARQLVWKMATSAGLPVTRLIHSHTRIPYPSQTLVVNGHITEVSYARATLRTASRAVRRHTAHNWAPGTIEFLVCVRRMAEDPEIFVLPEHELAKYVSGRISIPVERAASYRNRQARVDFWKYLNAWNLFL